MRMFFLASLAVVTALLVLPSGAQTQSRFFPLGKSYHYVLLLMF